VTRRRIEIPDHLLGCIRYRHAMRPDGMVPRRRRMESVYATEVTLHCDFCGSDRHDWYNSLGQLEAQTYDLTAEYEAALRVMRTGHVDRFADATLEVVARLREPKPKPVTKARRLRAVS
jgi:hypothetical protein